MSDLFVKVTNSSNSACKICRNYITLKAAPGSSVDYSFIITNTEFVDNIIYLSETTLDSSFIGVYRYALIQNNIFNIENCTLGGFIRKAGGSDPNILVLDNTINISNTTFARSDRKRIISENTAFDIGTVIGNKVYGIQLSESLVPLKDYGSLANAPSGVTNGFRYYATDLKKYIVFHSSKWIEEDGATAGTLRSGTTANRPVSTDIYTGFRYFDTDLGFTVYWDGTRWVEKNGFTANIKRGTTTQRNSLISGSALTNTDFGFDFFDTDLNKPLYLSVTGTGTELDPYVYSWVDANGSDPDAQV